MSPAATRKVLVVVTAAAVFFAGMFVRGLLDSDAEAPATSSTGDVRLSGEQAADVDGGASADGEDSDGPDEPGAVAAALDLAARPQAWLYLSDEDLDDQVRAVASQASADVLVDEIVAEVSLAREALSHSSGRVWWMVRPLAWRVDRFAGSRAQVSVWTVSVLSAAAVAMPQSDWTTTTLDLEWDGNRWLLVSSRDVPGPTPQLGGGDGAWDPVPFDDALDGFQRVDAEATP